MDIQRFAFCTVLLKTITCHYVKSDICLLNFYLPRFLPTINAIPSTTYDQRRRFMKMKTLLLSAALLLTSSAATAHDFWLAPSGFTASKPTAFGFQFKVGHKDDINHWSLTWDKIVALRAYSSSGVLDMASSIVPRTSLVPGLAKTPVLNDGTYVIGFESYHSVSVLGAEKFNDYASKEGLTAILNHRKERGQEQVAGSELYSRKAKSIVQVGKLLTDNATKAIGHTLEIVPTSHPYSLKDNTLTVKVLYKGRPLKGAKIDAIALGDSAETEQASKTNDNGEATFAFSKAGAVKINVVWGEPLVNNEKADFETYFSSLTFEVL